MPFQEVFLLSSFYRPPSSRTVRPTRRRPGRRLLVPALTLLLLAAIALGGLVVLRTHPRFAVTRVVLDGVPEARRAEAEELTDGWIGRPALFVDLQGPIAELSKRSWVASASARRVVPGTIAVVVVARPPVALSVRADRDGELYLCRRCANRFWPELSTQGWTIWPVGEHAEAAEGDRDDR